MCGVGVLLRSGSKTFLTHDHRSSTSRHWHQLLTLTVLAEDAVKAAIKDFLKKNPGTSAKTIELAV